MTKSIGKKLAKAGGAGLTGWTGWDLYNNPEALMNLLEAIKAVPMKEGGPARQPYGLGSFVKKITRPIKKIVKSPLGKAAALGLGAYFMPGIGAKASGGWGPWLSRIGGAFGEGKFLAPLVRNKAGEFSLGRAALSGLGAAAISTPFIQKLMKTGPYEEIEEETEDWDIQPASIANIMGQAKDYYRNYDPYVSSLNYMPAKEFVNPLFYSAKGGLAKLANGGSVAEAQAEQMLKMEYQKYRNQGGTMSYQAFKMQVLKQAQAQGPMAQGQPQMMNTGGRIGLKKGSKKKRSWIDFLYDEEGFNLPGFMIPASMTASSLLPFLKEGGRVPAQEGGLMDMGGMEKDYRNEGGFVAIGGKEKADDVPARLSKNEFVFTADAVRNAGGGDIDAGAEIMENMMKNLEAGGEISEESQGAQGMYNNMKQLETRIA